MVTLLDGRPGERDVDACTRWSATTRSWATSASRARRTHDGEIELGYRILTAHRRQGLALAAAGLMVARADREPAVTRVLATISPDNVASIGVITKAGFIPDGDRMHPAVGPPAPVPQGPQPEPTISGTLKPW